jgi:hypothetical protein
MVPVRAAGTRSMVSCSKGLIKKTSCSIRTSTFFLPVLKNAERIRAFRFWFPPPEAFFRELQLLKHAYRQYDVCNVSAGYFGFRNCSLQKQFGVHLSGVPVFENSSSLDIREAR